MKEKLAIEWLEQKWKEYDLSLGKSGFSLFLKQAAEIEKHAARERKHLAYKAEMNTEAQSEQMIVSV